MLQAAPPEVQSEIVVNLLPKESLNYSSPVSPKLSTLSSPTPAQEEKTLSLEEVPPTVLHESDKKEKDVTTQATPEFVEVTPQGGSNKSWWASDLGWWIGGIIITSLTLLHSHATSMDNVSGLRSSSSTGGKIWRSL
jgi:hypothetical protein